jgi:hypothetical protein
MSVSLPRMIGQYCPKPVIDYRHKWTFIVINYTTQNRLAYNM